MVFTTRQHLSNVIIMLLLLHQQLLLTLLMSTQQQELYLIKEVILLEYFITAHWVTTVSARIIVNSTLFIFAETVYRVTVLTMLMDAKNVMMGTQLVVMDAQVHAGSSMDMSAQFGENSAI